MYRGALLGLVALLPLAAQTFDYSVRVWQTEHGLPQNRIQALAQTPDGYLWVGTPAGLARFDGRRFTVFDGSNTPELGDNSILSLAVARDGGLWIGTEGGGLVRYRQGSFRPALSQITNGFVRALYEDGRGVLWIGTDRGYFRRDASGDVKRLDGSPPLGVAAVHAIQGGPDGRVWATSNLGLLSADGEPVISAISKEPWMGRGRAILATRGGSVWMSSPLGLLNLTGTASTQLRLATEARPHVLIEARDGSLWVGTQGAGLLRVVNGRVAQPRLAPLPDLTILCLFEDKDGSIWVGTQDGLMRVTRATVTMLSSQHGLGGEHVMSVFADNDGSVWIGSANGKLTIYRDGSLKPYRLPVSAPPFRPILAYRDRQGVVWLGSRLDGLARVEPNGRVDIFNIEKGLRTNSVRQVIEDRDGRIWAALGSGLAVWSGRAFHSYYLEDGLAYGSVRVLLESRDGSLLVGTDGGVNRIRGTRIVKDPALDALRGAKVWALLEDRQGSLWVGTRGRGLFRLRNGELRQFTTRHGLTANSIHQLVDDQRGNLWMTGPMGIASVAWTDFDRNPDALTLTSYGQAAGLPSTEMSGGLQPVACRTPAGELWFASVKGAARITPANAKVLPPQVLVEGIRAADHWAPTNGGVATVPAGAHKLEIDFTASDFLSAESARFRYMLEGFDNTWTPASQERTAVYTNLPPGTYRFRVASLGAIPAEASIVVTMKAHFYQTGWFTALAILGACLLSWAGLQWYAHQTKARYALLLAERNRLAREMHDTVIQGCVGVSALLEAAALQGTPHLLVDEARDRIRSTIDEARQAVWDLRHDCPGGSLAASLADFVSRFSSESSVPIGLEVSGAATRLDAPAERNILLIAREAIRNALTHASPTRIDLHLHYAASEMCLEVSDNGRGFQPLPAAEEGHYGIMGMHERAHEMGGNLQIRSAPGRGTTLRARLPLRERVGE